MVILFIIILVIILCVFEVKSIKYDGEWCDVSAVIQLETRTVSYFLFKIIATEAWHAVEGPITCVMQ